MSSGQRETGNSRFIRFYLIGEIQAQQIEGLVADLEQLNSVDALCELLRPS